jgi:hypothetical protein
MVCGVSWKEGDVPCSRPETLSVLAGVAAVCCIADVVCIRE